MEWSESTLRVAFRIPDTFWGKLIAFRSEGRFSHVEAIFPNGFSFSSREKEGVAFKLLPYSHRSDQWVIYELPFFTLDQLETMELWARAQNGKRYDYVGLIRFVTRKIGGDPEAWFCSEIVTTLLQKGGMLLSLNPQETSPVDLEVAIRVWQEATLGTVTPYDGAMETIIS